MGKPKVEEILKQMEQMLGEEPRPMVLMSKFVFDLPNIPAKYKHLIMIAVASAVRCPLRTETFIKIAHRAGVSMEEIGEA
jgi:alkylhydroperoxidase/carboxymuconolactone decarboxylase family protein YurZ